MWSHGEKWTHARTDRQINISSIFKDKLSLQGSLYKWYLHWGSSLQHSFHPKLDHSATTLGEKDLQNNDLKLVSYNFYLVSFYIIATGIYSICVLLFQVNVLYDANVPPSTISKIMSTLHEDDKGTLLPKTIFNITKKTRAYWTWQMEYCNQWPRLRGWLKFSPRKFDENL